MGDTVEECKRARGRPGMTAPVRKNFECPHQIVVHFRIQGRNSIPGPPAQASAGGSFRHGPWSGFVRLRKKRASVRAGCVVTALATSIAAMGLGA